MSVYKKVFIDTAPFIYLMESHPLFYDKMECFLSYCRENDIAIVTSVISYMEFSIKPYELGRIEAIEDFKEMLIDLNVQIYDINLKISDIAAQIRASNLKFRQIDSLQLATAIYSESRIFVTNDKQLKSFKKLKIVLVDDLSKIVNS
jgi:predicted nucleic acid-binding protein